MVQEKTQLFVGSFFVRKYWMKTLKALYREHPNIQPVPLEKLSVMTYHMDERWKWRDLPRMKDGMWYPILYDKQTLEWWNTRYKGVFGYAECWDIINPPTVNDDGFVYCVRLGNNRIVAAKHMGYDAIDCIHFDRLKDLLDYARFLKSEDPYNNP